MKAPRINSGITEKARMVRISCHHNFLWYSRSIPMTASQGPRFSLRLPGLPVPEDWGHPMANLLSNGRSKKGRLVNLLLLFNQFIEHAEPSGIIREPTCQYFLQVVKGGHVPGLSVMITQDYAAALAAKVKKWFWGALFNREKFPLFVAKLPCGRHDSTNS